MATRKFKATEKQKRAVNNIISGNFSSHAEAMREAGYAKTTSHRPAEKLLSSKGVATYIGSLDVVSQQKWGLNLPNKLALTFLDCLSAEKPYGKDAKLFPDWKVRLASVDKFAEFFGWGKEAPSGQFNQQATYFSVPENKRTYFNNIFKEFLKELPATEYT